MKTMNNILAKEGGKDNVSHKVYMTSIIRTVMCREMKG